MSVLTINLPVIEISGTIGFLNIAAIKLLKAAESAVTNYPAFLYIYILKTDNEDAPLAFLLLLSGCIQTLPPKTCDWIRFEDKKSHLAGYKDTSGRIMITAKLNPFTNSLVFKNIMGVFEGKGSHPYYLLKDGRKIGTDSVHVNEMMMDCESEEKIRFRNPVTDKVGFFDKEGNIIIPALYNEATPFLSGLSFALKGAKRICWEGGEFTENKPCEHWSWQGGKMVLINPKNRELVVIPDSLRNAALDRRTLNISKHKDDRPGRVSLRGADGNYYSFTEQEKEFKNWFYKTFLAGLKEDASLLPEYCYKEITAMDNAAGSDWRHYRASDFLNTYRQRTVASLSKAAKGEKRIRISAEDLNPFIFQGSNFRPYYNVISGEHRREEFPVYEVILDNKEKDLSNSGQSFQFIRTAAGYRLIMAVF